MDAHAFMAKFNEDNFYVPLHEILDASFFNCNQLDGMEFILLDYYVKSDGYGNYWYIIFREIENDKVLEPAYTIITDNLYDGIEGFSYRVLNPFIGDRMKLTRKIPQSNSCKIRYALKYLETYDYESRTFIDAPHRWD